MAPDNKASAKLRFKGTSNRDRDRSRSPRRDRERKDKDRRRDEDRVSKSYRKNEDSPKSRRSKDRSPKNGQSLQNSETPSSDQQKSKQPASLAPPQQPMIIVHVNDRLGTKAAVLCFPSDPIKLFKAQVAAQIGRQPHEILLKRQSERPFNDALTLEDYGISNGVQLDLELDTGD